MDKQLKIQDHIFIGIKRTIPFIVLYSVLLALGELNSFFGLISEYVYILIVPVLTANIIYSYGKFKYILPAVITGFIASYEGMGILGGIIIGFLILGSVLVYDKHVKEQIKNNLYVIVLFNILLSIVFVIITKYGISPPVNYLLDFIYDYLLSIDKTNVILLVIVLSFLITVDLGGPFNKIAFAFLIEAYLSGNYEIVGPVLISTTIPPLSIYLGMILYKNRFSKDDLSQKKLTIFASIVGMTEGAMSVAFRRIKILPILIIGSIAGSVFAAIFDLENHLLLNAVPGLLGTSNIFIYLLSHLVGVAICLILFPIVLKKIN